MIICRFNLQNKVLTKGGHVFIFLQSFKITDSARMRARTLCKVKTVAEMREGHKLVILYKDDPEWVEDAPIVFTADQAREWQKQAQIYAEQFKRNIQIIEDEIAQKKSAKNAKFETMQKKMRSKMRKPYSEWTEEAKKKARERARKWQAEHPYSEWTEEKKEKKRENNRKWQAEHPWSERSEEAKGKQMERNRKYEAEHPEKRKEWSHKYYTEHREEMRERLRAWRAENKEKARELSKKYYAKHAEKVKERVRKWGAENKENALEYQRNYRAKKRAQRLAQQEEQKASEANK